MSKKIERVFRGRRLTAEEVARDEEVRQKVRAEFPPAVSTGRTEPAIDRDQAFTLRLQPDEAESVREMAKSKGIDGVDLIREWILEKLRSA